MLSVLPLLALCAVVWKALDTVQKLSVLAAAATPVERAQAFTAAVAKPVKREEPGEPRPVLEGLSPRE